MGTVGVQSHEFLSIYPAVKWHFDSFAERSGGETTASDLARDVLNQNRQCWLFVDETVKACALTKVEDGNLRVVTLTHCAGKEREGWQEQIVSDLREWAASIGAKRFRTVNRPGWTRMLRGMGLRETHRIMEVDLGDG